MKLTQTALALGVGVLVSVLLACTEGARRDLGRVIADAGSWIADADGLPDAHAQTEPSSCLQWEVRGILPSSIRWTSFSTTNPDGSPNEYSFPVMEPFSLPEGWEPFGGESLGAILARRCARR